MSIFWTFSTCIGDGFGQIWWTLTYQRRFLDVIQSRFAVRNVIRLDVILMKCSSSGVRFFLSVRSRAVSSQLCLHETINYLVSNCFMNIKMKSNMINLENRFRHVNHSAAFVSGRLLRFRSIVKAPPSLLNSENGYLYLFVYDFWKYVSKCRLEFIYRKRTPSTFNSQSGEPPCNVTSPTLRLFLAH